jgi:uncharacterized protein (TIRG00374 family)
VKVTATPLPRATAADLAEPLPDEVAPRRLWRSLGVLAAIAVGVAAAIVLVPGIGDLREQFAHASPWWVVLGVALEVASTLSYVVAFRAVFCTRMRWSASYKIAVAELGADSVLPVGGAGGLALGAWALRRGGMPGEQIARKTVAFFLLTSVPNVVLLFVLGIALSLRLVPGHVGLALTIVPAAVAVGAIAGTLLIGRLSDRAHRRRAEAGAKGAFRRLLPVLRAVADGVDDALAMLRTRDPRLLAGVVGYMAFDLLVLWAAFRALGSTPPLALIAIAYVIGQLGNLVPLPGGVGGVEGGLIGALVVYGVEAVPATAAVLLYRAIQLWVPAGLGAVAFVQLRRMLRGEATEIALCKEGDVLEVLGRGPVVVSRPVAAERELTRAGPPRPPPDV